MADTDHTAVGQALGYIYQLERATYRLLHAPAEVATKVPKPARDARLSDRLQKSFWNHLRDEEMAQGSWGTPATTEGTPDNWSELSDPPAIPCVVRTVSVVATMRHALAHAKFYTTAPTGAPVEWIKSYLNSRRIHPDDLKMIGWEGNRYKILTIPALQQALATALLADYGGRGLIDPQTSVRYGLAAGHIRAGRDSDVEAIAQNGWFYLSRQDIIADLQRFSESDYENSPFVMTAKLLAER